MMTAQSSEPVKQATEIISAPVPDPGLRRLCPANGLFLRAEHLVAILEYCEQFALVAGVSAGAGVDHGLNAYVVGNTLKVSAGLAVDRSRRPLRLSDNTQVPLEHLEPDEYGLWIVEIMAADPVVPEGLREPVYGTLCDDPCGGSSVIPWCDASVVIRVRREDISLSDVAEGCQRSQVAAAYFGREQPRSKRWLPPVGSGRTWGTAEPAEAPTPGAVPIAGLLRENGKWVVDTWIARRDIDGPPSRTAWEGHLGLRPWNVFIAQVLQFQAQLADVLERETPTARNETQLPLYLDQIRRAMPSLQGKRGTGTEGLDAVEEAVHMIAQAVPTSPRDTAGRSFVELPPAGIVPLPVRCDPVAHFRRLFGKNKNLVLEVEYSRPDCALSALEDAQHLDRIRLDQCESDSYVRLLIPEVTNNRDFGWMVFVHDCCANDRVDVYVHDASSGEDGGTGLNTEKGPDGSQQWEDTYVTTLVYPRGSWSLPSPPRDSTKHIRDKIGERSISEIIGYANSSDRRSLAFVRSQLLLFDVSTDGEEQLAQSLNVSDGKESICIVVSQSQDSS